MKTFTALLTIQILVFALWGWCANIAKLSHDSFEAPYNAEVIRGLGVIVAPVGAVTGYITFDKEKK